jgi:hypothetical protein
MTGIAPGGIVLSESVRHSFRRSCVGMPSATLCVIFGQRGRLSKDHIVARDPERRGRRSYAERRERVHEAFTSSCLATSCTVRQNALARPSAEKK